MSDNKSWDHFAFFKCLSQNSLCPDGSIVFFLCYYVFSFTVCAVAVVTHWRISTLPSPGTAKLLVLLSVPTFVPNIFICSYSASYVGINKTLMSPAILFLFGLHELVRIIMKTVAKQRFTSKNVASLALSMIRVRGRIRKLHFVAKSISIEKRIKERSLDRKRQNCWTACSSAAHLGIANEIRRSSMQRKLHY